MKTALNKRLASTLLIALFAVMAGAFVYNILYPGPESALRQAETAQSAQRGQAEGGLPSGLDEAATHELSHLMEDYEKNPNDVKNLLALGEFFHKRKMWAEAENVFSRAVGVDQKNATAHYWLAMTLYNNGKPDVAIQAFETVLGIERNPRAMFNLALLYRSVRNNEEGAKKLLQELAAMPEAPEDLREMAKQQLQLPATQQEKN